MKIENNHGKIIFREPINLLKTTKTLSQGIKISNSNISIYEEEWKQKKCEIILYNFKNYLDGSIFEKENITNEVKRMREENNKKMEVAEFDRDLGNLYLRSSGI